MVNNDVLLMVAKSGVFAVLFVILLFYVLKDSRNREQNYQKIVNKLTTELNAVFKIEEDVEQIKTIVLAKPLYNVEENIWKVNLEITACG